MIRFEYHFMERFLKHIIGLYHKSSNNQKKAIPALDNSGY